jgi:hypothetical protein
MNIEAAANRCSPNSARAASVVISAKGHKRTTDPGPKSGFVRFDPNADISRRLFDIR